jgi:hypothetical protein
MLQNEKRVCVLIQVRPTAVDTKEQRVTTMTHHTRAVASEDVQVAGINQPEAAQIGISYQGSLTSTVI